MIAKDPKWARLDFRLTHADLAAWRQAAQKGNMSLSEFIRQRVNGGGDGLIDPGPPLLLRDMRYVYHHPPEKDLTEGHKHFRALKLKDFARFCELLARLEREFSQRRLGKSEKKQAVSEDEEEDHALDLAKSLKAALPT